jgi:serine/threonine protein kinase/Tfp pilus assembly protein PilF
MAGTSDSLLERHVRAYELALCLGAADLEAYLPSRNSPVYLEILVDLLRLEMAWSWRQGKPKGVEDYLAQFPEVRDSPPHCAALVAEEARLRRRYTAVVQEGTVLVAVPSLELGDLATRVVESLRKPERGAHFPKPGDVFLDFRLVSELGRGAFGRVFLAHQGGLAERPVALKVAVDLHQESNTLAQLQHTNIVPIYSVHRAGNLHAVCMPYLGATTLGDIYRNLLLEKRLPRSGQALVSTWRERRTRSKRTATEPESATTVPEPVAVQTAFHALAGLSYIDAILWLTSRLADGLAHAHDRGILHRDLKPANILLTDDGEPMLLDFNLASDSKVDATLAQVGGTLQYMSPEQIKAFTGLPVPLTPSSDLYSLGIILFELLTGCPPFPAHQHAEPQYQFALLQADRREGVASPRRLNPAISPAVEAIILRCLDPDPKRRYQSARELGEDLRRHLDNRPLKYARNPSLRERLSKFRRRHPRLLSLTTCVAAVLVLGLTLGLALYWRGERVASLEARENARQLHEDRRELEFLLTTRKAETRAQEALARGEQALGRFPDGTARLGRLPEADQEQVREDLRDVYAWCAQAHLLLVNPVRPADTEEHLSQAEKLLAEALRRYPEEVPLSVRLQQARVARLRGHSAEAQALEKQAQAQVPLSAQDRYRLAFTLVEQGKYRQALDAVSDSIDQDPAPFNAWFLRGLCCDHLGRESESVQCYTVCVALKPAVSVSYFNRGLARARQRQFALARKDFDEVIRLEPAFADAYFNRGLTFQATEQFKEAEADLTKALELGWEETRLYFVRAGVRKKLNDPEGAEKDRAEGLRREPRDAKSWVARGLNRLTSNPSEPQAALADFDAALRVDPRSRDALLNKAHVLSKYLSRTEDAIRVLDQAVSLYPEDVRPRAGRGVLRARLGQDGDAIKDAEAALALEDQPANQYQVAGIYALVSQRDPACRDTAFRLLTQALKKGFGGDFLAIDNDLDPIRKDPRFAQIEALARR